MTRMPFGLNNSASTFQRTMELALQGLQWETCLIYIDGIIVFGATLEEHLDRVEKVFEKIKAAGLKFKPEKCSMLQTKVVFLGHVVSKDGVRLDLTNVSKIFDWPKPENAKQVKHFVATGSYYRRFIRSFAKIAKPLTDLTKKDKTLSRCQNPKECSCAGVDTLEPLKCGPCKICWRLAELMQWSGLSSTGENQKAEREEAAQRVSEKSKVCKTTTPTESTPSTSTGVTQVPVTMVTRSRFWVKNATKVRELQLQDPNIGPSLLAKEDGNKPLAKNYVTASPASRHYWLLWDQLEVRNGVIFKRFYSKAGLEDNFQLIVLSYNTTVVSCYIMTCLKTYISGMQVITMY